jgi:hypothetical protein
MYLTAQHVRSPATGTEGVNAFIYGHGPYQWLGWPPFLPEENPGTLFDREIAVLPGGNRVLSYLDILTPDTTSPAGVQNAFDQLMALYPQAGERFPGGVEVGDAWFRFDLAPQLVPIAEEELRRLYGHGFRLLSRHPTA